MTAGRRIWGLILAVMLPLAGCESKAEREAHDKEVFEQGRKQGLAEGEASGLAKAREESAKAQAEAEKAAADRLQAAKAEVRAHPAQYVTVIGTKWLEKPPVGGFRQISEAMIMNQSDFPIQIRGANVTYADDKGTLFGARPVMLTAPIPAKETKTFSQQTGTLSTGSVNGEPTRADLQVTDIEVLNSPRAP